MPQPSGSQADMHAAMRVNTRPNRHAIDHIVYIIYIVYTI